MATSSEPRLLALVTDAFGGHGGIALYMRDVLRCLASSDPACRISLIARIGENSCVRIPPNIQWHTEALSGKAAYVGCLARALLRGPKPDLIICGHINLLPLARIAAWRAGAPIVLFIHGIEAWKPPRGRWAARWAKYADLVLSVSRVTRARFLEWSALEPGRVALMPNAVKLERYGQGLKSPELLARYKLEDKRVLMTLGRLWGTQRHKGIDEIMAVLPELLKRFPDLVYLVAGGGDDLPRLRLKAKELGVEQYIVFTGLVDEREKADHYRLADGFALTGHGDGFGFVLLEAMACGVPVAASVLDGSREAIREGQLGILLDPSDKDSLVDGLSQLMSRPKGIPEGLEYFAYPNFCRRLQEVIRPLL